MRGVSISFQIFLGVVLTGLLVTAVMGALFYLNFKEGFTRYIARAEMAHFNDLVQPLADEYDAQAGGWPALQGHSRAWYEWVRTTLPGPDSGAANGAQPPTSQPSDRPEPVVQRQTGPQSTNRPRPQGGFAGPGARSGPRGSGPSGAPSGFSRRLSAPGPNASGPAANGGQPGTRPPGKGDAMRIAGRLFLTDPQGNILAGFQSEPGPTVDEAIFAMVDGQERLVGWLKLSSPNVATGPSDKIFIRNQTKAILLTALAAMILAMGSAYVLSRRMIRPLRALSQGAKRLAGGDYRHHIPTRRRDEIGELVHHYNTLAASLEAAQQSERQFLSDTSHELQTPIAVLRAEIEAIQDGIREANDRNLSEMHSSVLRLSNLVRDLQVLAFSREGRFELAQERVDVQQLAESVCISFEARAQIAGIDLILDADDDLIVQGDANRLSQVLTNLIENAIRYTDAPGRIVLMLRRDGPEVVMRIEDTAPAPDAGILPDLFDRFARGEKSRSRASGGSGLGLAITQAIVEGHGGRIQAALSGLGGLAVTISIPAEA